MSGLLCDVLQHFRRLVTAPREELSLFQRSLAFWMHLVVSCAGELKSNKAPQVAAALTYHTLFSLVPMLVLGLLVFRSVQGLESSAERFETLVIEILLPETALDPGLSPLLEANALDTQREFDDARALLRGQFRDYIRQLSELNLTGLGIAGLLVFLYGASSLLRTVESSFDSIYRAGSRRPVRIQIPLYFTIMTLGPVVLVGSLLLQDRLQARMASTPGIEWLTALSATLSPILAIWAVLFVLLFFVPNTRVKRRAALSGSLLATLLLLLMQKGFGIYVGSTAITSLYGALAVIPILLLWIYLLWLVVLFGLEVSYSLQFLSVTGPWKEDFELPLTGDPAWLVPILTHIGRGFADGRSTNRATLRADCGLPLSTLGSFLRQLEEKGWIHEVVDKGGESRYVLARPPSQISIREVLSVELPQHQPDAAWDYLEKLRSTRDGAVGDDTLASLL